MPADKKNGDGLLRQDFPGGWEGDSRDFFAGENVNDIEKEAFDLTRRLLKWRKGNPLVAEGKLLQIPLVEGVYIYQRVLPSGGRVTIMLNGTNEEKRLTLSDLPLSMPLSVRDFFTGKTFSGEAVIPARDVLLLE